MRVMFDTNIYIGLLREGAHIDLFRDPFMTRYMAGTVLMELWAGATTTRAARAVQKLQTAYTDCGRIIVPAASQFVQAGQVLSDLSPADRPRLREAGFINDLHIALSARSIGATVYTRNRSDFEILATHIAGLLISPVP